MRRSAAALPARRSGLHAGDCQRSRRRLEMSKIASELLVERLIDWGVDTVFGLPGDGINGIMEALRRQRGPDPVRPRDARGSRRLHGVRLREVHRQARRVPGNVRPRRHPPAQRPLRREAGPPAGARDHRDAGDGAAGHRLPAGGAPREALHGRRAVQRDGARPGRDPGARRPSRQDVARAPHRLAPDVPKRRPDRRRGRHARSLAPLRRERRRPRRSSPRCPWSRRARTCRGPRGARRGRAPW